MLFSPRVTFFALFLFAFLSRSFAQQFSYGSLGLRRIYQSTAINPTRLPDKETTLYSFGLLPFVDFGFNAYVSSVSLGKISQSVDANNLFSIDQLIKNMNSSPNSDMGMGLNTSLFHIYMPIGKKRDARLEISQHLRADVTAVFLTKNLFQTIFSADLVDQRTIDLSNLRFRGIAYNEIAVGYTRPINSAWTVGGRVKLLTGIAFADFEAQNMAVQLGQTNNQININGTLRTAGMAPLADSVNKTSMQAYKNVGVNPFKNLGMAVDIGATYYWKSDLNVFFGVNDLGFINWKNNPLQYTAQVNNAQFSPIKIENGKSTSNIDTISTLFKNGSTVKTTSFISSLTSHWHVGLNWLPKQKYLQWLHTTSMLDFYILQGRFLYPGVTVAATANAGKWGEFSMNTGYNIGRYWRLGAGTSFNWFLGIPWLRFYLFSNDISPLFSAKNLNGIDINLGLNWTFKAKKGREMGTDDTINAR